MSELVLPLRNRLNALPLVLAGPMVRRVEAEQVTVWIALRRPACVRLEIRSGDTVLMDGVRATVPLGEHLHVVAVTAAGAVLDWGKSYSYQLFLDDGRDLYAPGVLAADPDQAAAMLTYPGGPGLPSFVLPPEEAGRVHVLQGSCRRPHKDGQDALPGADTLIEAGLAPDQSRPQMLFITGDHIYADSMSELLLLLASDIGNTLLGWREFLPDIGRYADEIAPGERQAIVRTSMRHPEPARYQLFGLGEFYAMHLLVITQALWPAPVVAYRGSDSTARRLARFAGALPAVRRALANIATYFTFDDHEVCDDWNLTLDWCQRVYGQPFGRRVVQNGLIAFAMFAAWGNMPDRFAPPDTAAAGPDMPAGAPASSPRGYALLQEVSAWRPIDAASSAPPADRHLLARLGIPESGEALRAHGDPPRLTPGESALDWHFFMRTPAFELIALDTRSQRAYPGKSELDPPELISLDGLARQLAPLAASGGAPLAIVVSASPLVYVPKGSFARAVDAVVRVSSALYHLVRGEDQPWARAKVYDPDIGDEWLTHTRSFGALMDCLLDGRDVVALSGDWHMGFAAVLSHSQGAEQALLVQCASGGFLNEDGLMWRRHMFGYKEPWPFPSAWPGEVHGKTERGLYSIRWLRGSGGSEVGREVVGKNNLGEVRLASSERGTEVTYTVWWRERDSEPAGPHTTYTAVIPQRDARRESHGARQPHGMRQQRRA